MSFRSFLTFSVCLFFLSCGSDKKQQSNGPIVLGDSAMIVTETDSSYLTNFVDDLQLKSLADDTLSQDSANASQPGVAQTENNAPQQPTPAAAQAPTGSGLSIPFKEVTVFIPDIKTKTYRAQNPQTSNGATYQWLNGRLNGNVLRLSGATITKVSQRHITKVIAKGDAGTLQLDALSNTTDWAPLRGDGKSYTITGLDRPETKKVTPAQIKQAVTRAAKNKRLSRANQQKWEREVRSVRSLNQKPFQAVVRSVMWKVEGKDASGKPFQKQIRIDINP